MWRRGWLVGSTVQLANSVKGGASCLNDFFVIVLKRYFKRVQTQSVQLHVKSSCLTSWDMCTQSNPIKAKWSRVCGFGNKDFLWESKSKTTCCTSFFTDMQFQSKYRHAADREKRLPVLSGETTPRFRSNIHELQSRILPTPPRLCYDKEEGERRQIVKCWWSTLSTAIHQHN